MGSLASFQPGTHLPPHPDPSVQLCGLSQLLCPPHLRCACVTGRRKGSRAHAALFALSPSPPGPANCWAKAALRASCSVGRAGRAAEDFGGRVKLAAGDDSPARYGLRASFLRQRGRGPAREGCQVPEQLGEHPLCLPSGQCLGWAWLGKPAESLGTEAKLPLGLGGRGGWRQGAQTSKPQTAQPSPLSANATPQSCTCEPKCLQPDAASVSQTAMPVPP